MAQGLTGWWQSYHLIHLSFMPSGSHGNVWACETSPSEMKRRLPLSAVWVVVVITTGSSSTMWQGHILRVGVVSVMLHQHLLSSSASCYLQGTGHVESKGFKGFPRDSTYTRLRCQSIYIAWETRGLSLYTRTWLKSLDRACTEWPADYQSNKSRSKQK